MFASVARWPKFRQNSSQGAGEKKSRPEEFLAEFWPNFTRSGRKGAKEDPYFTVMTKTQRQRQNLIFISIDPRAERCIDVFVNSADLSPKLAELFDVLARKQFWDLATLMFADSEAQR
jgi:hypothetical protein